MRIPGKTQRENARENQDDYEKVDQFPAGRHQGIVLYAKEEEDGKWLVICGLNVQGRKVKYFHRVWTSSYDNRLDNFIRAMVPKRILDATGEDGFDLVPGSVVGVRFTADFEPARKGPYMHLKAFATTFEEANTRGGQQRQQQGGGQQRQQRQQQGGGQQQARYGTNYRSDQQQQPRQQGGWGNQGGQQQPRQQGGWGEVQRPSRSENGPLGDGGGWGNQGQTYDGDGGWGEDAGSNSWGSDVPF